MVVGTLKIEFCLPENRSLKGKRKVVRSMIDKVKSRFNVSVAEVGSNDKWQKIELGISAIGNDRRHIDSSLNHILGGKRKRECGKRNIKSPDSEFRIPDSGLGNVSW
jgi:uncharacterized protein YlxP (DUF503 family)